MCAPFGPALGPREDRVQTRRPVTPLSIARRVLENRIARVISLPDPEPVISADELAKIYDADELGVVLHQSGPHRIERPSTRNDRPRATVAGPGRPTAEFDVPEQLLEVTLPHHAQRRTSEFDVPAALLADAGAADEQEYVPEAPVEIPLPSSRSLIPNDILEAIAAEDAAALSLEADDRDDWDADEAHAVEDHELELVSEHAEPGAVEELLARTRLLDAFPREALERLAQGAVRMHLVDRQPAFRQGAPADSFFVVESGAVELVCAGYDGVEVALGHVHAREPFGLFGLLTHKHRTATAQAIGDAVVVELSAQHLDHAARAYPEVRQTLARYFKDRLLENFLAVSPLFRNLDAVGRAALISHFQDRKVAAGEILLSPGEVQNGISLVTSGEICISRRQSPGRDVELARLHRGEYYGVVSALAGLPTRANVVASEPTTLCVLPQRAFNEFVKGYPVLRSLPARMSEAGQQVERDLFVGDATGQR